MAARGRSRWTRRDAGASPEDRRLAPDGGPVVSISNVTKVYTPYPPFMRILLRSSIKSSIVALNDVSVDVEAGSILAIVGPNGAGKSTLFRILTGLTTPTEGSATICGFDVTSQAFHVRSRVGFAPADERTLLLRHTCRENLMFHGKLQGMELRGLLREVDATLELVGLGKAKNRAGIALSSGMKARLQLARALLHRPAVLILDEPTGAIDPLAAYEVLEIIKQAARERNIATLISSHRLEEIEALHDNVVLMDQGKIVYKGDLDVMRETWDKPGLEIVFEDAASATRVAELVVNMGLATISEHDGVVLTLSSDLGTGKLIHALTGQTEQIRSFREVKLPLRDLLAKILLSGDAT